MEEQRWVKSSAARLTGALQGATSLAEFGERLLSGLVPMLGGGVAGFYVAESEPEGARRSARIACGAIAGYGLARRSTAPAPKSPSARAWSGNARAIARRSPDRSAVGFLPISSGLGRAAPTRVGGGGRWSRRTRCSASWSSRRSGSSPRRARPPRGTAAGRVDEPGDPRAQSRHRGAARTEPGAGVASSREQKEELRHQHFLADSALDLTKSGYWHVPLDGSGWYNSSERAARIFGDLPSPGHRYCLDDWAAHVREGDEAAAQVTAENFAAAVAGDDPGLRRGLRLQAAGSTGAWSGSTPSATSSRTTSGKPADMYGVTQDITDFKLLETELIGARDVAEAASRAKADFLANMSHEIRTPMNAVLGMTHLALKTELSAKQRDYLDKVASARPQSLLGIINDILDFSKIEAGKLDMERIPFDLEEVLDNLATLVTVKAQEKEGLEVLFRRSADVPPTLVGDPLRLGQVLVNLANNAVKFTEKGEIVVSTEVVHRRRVDGRARVRGARHRHRHDRRAAGAALHLVQPGRQLDHPQVRRHRPRACRSASGSSR